MSHTTDHSEDPSHESSEPPSEHFSQQTSESPSGQFTSTKQESIPHTVIEWHDTSEDSDASSHKTPVQTTPPVPVYGPQTGYGLRGRVTARKSVPIPIRRTFRIPLKDEAGPSNYRDRSMTSSPSSSSSESQGVTIKRHDRDIYALVKLLGTNNQALHRITDVVGHIQASIQQLYIIVYLLMALLAVMFGCLMLGVKY